MLFIFVIAHYLSITFLVLNYRKDEDFKENIAISINLSNALLIIALISGGFIKWQTVRR